MAWYAIVIFCCSIIYWSMSLIGSTYMSSGTPLFELTTFPVRGIIALVLLIISITSLIFASSSEKTKTTTNLTLLSISLIGNILLFVPVSLLRDRFAGLGLKDSSGMVATPATKLSL